MRIYSVLGINFIFSTYLSRSLALDWTYSLNQIKKPQQKIESVKYRWQDIIM